MNNNLSNKLNKLIADSFMLYVKMHNLHWNVVGQQFKPVHEFLETVYNGLADELDALAEILKMNEVYPVASVNDYVEVSDVKELESKNYSVVESLTIALEELTKHQGQFKETRRLADELGEFTVVAKMEELFASYEKTNWFLKSMLV